MSTYTLDTSTSRANPTPAPMRRLTCPKIQARKGGEPIVVLTAYTARMAQLLDFVAAIGSTDAIAPVHGTLRLADYLEERRRAGPCER